MKNVSVAVGEVVGESDSCAHLVSQLGWRWHKANKARLAEKQALTTLLNSSLVHSVDTEQRVESRGSPTITTIAKLCTNAPGSQHFFIASLGDKLNCMLHAAEATQSLDAKQLSEFKRVTDLALTVVSNAAHYNRVFSVDSVAFMDTQLQHCLGTCAYLYESTVGLSQAPQQQLQAVVLACNRLVEIKARDQPQQVPRRKQNNPAGCTIQ
eukprot:TRINITY_DN95534_c0_g1_i1.p1 TRINITY_DN95534_c0_g1~~TRINITY_DN95534_c0_g1_i1.p1  ORF type:complete len:210 (-),score=16.10 TRINITY_DN95534_c0_g1_i1:110-739(-)